MKMSKSILSGMFKLCALFAVCLFAAARLPVTADEPARGAATDRSDEVMRSLFAAGSTVGTVKFCQLNGNKPVTPEQVIKIYRIHYNAFPRILAAVRKAGLYDDYRRQIFDPELRRLDAEAAGVRTIGEFESIAGRQISHMREKYPRLWNWSCSNGEMSGIITQIFQDIDAVLK